MSLQEFFRKNLAAFQLRRLPRRPYNRPFPLAKSIRQPVDQRKFRPHDCKVRPDPCRQPDQRCNVSRVHCHAFRFPGDPSVARSAPDLFHPGALLQLPHQRVLTPSAAYDNNLHPQDLVDNSFER